MSLPSTFLLHDKLYYQHLHELFPEDTPCEPRERLLLELWRRGLVLQDVPSPLPARDESVPDWVNPEDEPSVLVWADQLLERGDPRGEFAALQCRAGSERRIRELLSQHEASWTASLGPLVTDWSWKRGLLWHAEVLPAGLPAWVGALLRALPTLRSLHVLQAGFFEAYAYVAPALAREPGVARLRELSLDRNRIGPAGTHALALSPHLDPLETLSLSQCDLGDEGVHPLLMGPRLRSLSTLCLSNNSLTSSIAEPLSRRGGLRTLELGYNALGCDGALALARSPHLDQLQSLLLQDNDLRDPGILGLVSSPHLRSLERLDLDPGKLQPNALSSQGLAQLAATPGLARLRELHLGGQELEPDALRRLLDSSHLSRLQTLGLDWSTLADPSARLDLAGRALSSVTCLHLTATVPHALALLERLPALQELRLILPRGSDSYALGRSPRLAPLRLLQVLPLGGSIEGDLLAEGLASSPHLARLEALELYELSDPGALALARSPHLRNLALLDLWATAVGDEGALALIETDALPALRCLDLSMTGLTPEGERALRASPGLARLEGLETGERRSRWRS